MINLALSNLRKRSREPFRIIKFLVEKFDQKVQALRKKKSFPAVKSLFPTSEERKEV
jgi:hypothetical protein